MYPVLAYRTLFLAFATVLGTAVTAGELYVGANYHPHDSDPKAWERDIALMRESGTRMVRLGHLAWDSYEPEDGRFDFAWFDTVMDRMHAAGIQVILDIPVRPAPLWLHRKHPSISTTDLNGVVQYPNHRYMEDVGDPVYQQYAIRFTDAMVARYREHPALVAFGIDNEPGDGRISYSAGARDRFIAWLQAKYGTLDALNHAWAGQRWSRRISAWEEVGFPYSVAVPRAPDRTLVGAPERRLDFRRFTSDEIAAFFSRVLERVETGAPGKLTTTNMWYYSDTKFFDYAPLAYSGRLTRQGCGFYPGVSFNDSPEYALFGIARIQYENTTPFWCTEFVSDTAVPGAMRRAAYASLMQGNQLVCIWTWQTMHAGEEQFLQGLVDWDGKPNRKYDEYRQIAAEFRKIEGHGFPYQPAADVALAFSYPSQIASASFPETHEAQVQTVYSAFHRRNLDTRVVDVTRSRLPYKLLVVPGFAVMDEASASAVRSFVENGGTVVMTGYSAVLDEHGQAFTTTHPGLLDDVFGIRIGGFEQSTLMNEISRSGTSGDRLRIRYGGQAVEIDAPRFDVIEAKGAEVVGTLQIDRDRPLITRHRFGRGTAIYVGVPARAGLLRPLIDDLLVQLAITPGPDVPEGVMARRIDAKHVLYLNLDGRPKEIRMPGRSRSILFDREYVDRFTLDPHGPDFVEIP